MEDADAVVALYHVAFGDTRPVDMAEIASSRSGDYPKMQDDGSALMRFSVHHAAPRDANRVAAFGIVVMRESTDEEPEPVIDRAAIRAGEPHDITLRLVQEDGGWRIDTDLLEILIDRVGTIAEISKPLSEQVG